MKLTWSHTYKQLRIELQVQGNHRVLEVQSIPTRDGDVLLDFNAYGELIGIEIPSAEAPEIGIL